MNRHRIYVLSIRTRQGGRGFRNVDHALTDCSAVIIWSEMGQAPTPRDVDHPAEQAKLLLVCPYTLFREALGTMLGESQFAPVALAATSRDADMIFSDDSDIDIILLCACDGDADEHDFIARICSDRPGTNIVLLTSHYDSTRMSESLNAGVDGYLTADISPAALLHALEMVRHGEKVFPSELARDFTDGLLVANSGGGDTDVGPLTQREQEIVASLVQGQSNKGIASDFGLSEATVKMHLRQIFSKIGVGNRTQAAAWAIGAGLVTPKLS
jgi:two-component system nitrate/nitrite response regulator NarL